MIYLDNNASMVLYPEAIDATVECLKYSANAGSPHTVGRNARNRMENSREKIAKLVGAKPEQLLFTSGATEANNIALLGGGESLALVSALEHSSVFNVHDNTDVIPVDKNGIVNLEWLDNRLKGEKAGDVVVSVMFASHETGVLQPVREVARITSKYLQRYHLDAVQGAGKAHINFQTLGADSLSLTAHKLGGPQGIGALIYDPALDLVPLVRGGGQEQGRRPGTPNISGISGFGAAAEICMHTLEDKTKKLNIMRDRMEATITQRHQCVEIASSNVDRLAGTSRLILPNVLAETQVMFFDLAGICVSAGAACSSGLTKSTRTLLAMGYEESRAGCSVRVGMSWQTTDEDIDTFIDVYGKMVSELST